MLARRFWSLPHSSIFWEKSCLAGLRSLLVALHSSLYICLCTSSWVERHLFSSFLLFLFTSLSSLEYHGVLGCSVIALRHSGRAGAWKSTHSRDITSKRLLLTCDCAGGSEKSSKGDDDTDDWATSHDKSNWLGTPAPTWNSHLGWEVVWVAEWSTEREIGPHTATVSIRGFWVMSWKYVAVHSANH